MKKIRIFRVFRILLALAAILTWSFSPTAARVSSSVTTSEILSVQLYYNNVCGFMWPKGMTLTATIDDPATPQSPDLTRIAQEHPEPGYPTTLSYYCANTSPIRIKPGFIATITDGIRTHTTTVADLFITGVNIQTDRVYGHAPANSNVGVDIQIGFQNQPHRSVFADSNGSWTADFSKPGINPDEQGIFNITYLTQGQAYVSDINWQITHTNWFVPPFKLFVPLLSSQ